MRGVAVVLRWTLGCGLLTCSNFEVLLAVEAGGVGAVVAVQGASRVLGFGLW